ncbi:chalcone isomerase family protein [Herminiimonas aquatilis]|uniref:Chalcone isomerase family protein n=1 Tax=Herminiimonas aquatilis TaxID=345342 RepID=A0ABW2J830_9BURK
MQTFKAIGCILAVSCALSFAHAASAVELAGIKLDDSVRLVDQNLRLNGAGIRHKVVFKVYVIGLYLTDKKTTVSDVLAAAGARRVTLVMLRDVGSEEFGKAFAVGIEQNTDAAERVTLSAPMARFNAMFTSIAELKQGDVLNLDWVPGSGMVVILNGKKILEPMNDAAFYNAVLRIWLGSKPVDDKLKRQLLSEP